WNLFPSAEAVSVSQCISFQNRSPPLYVAAASEEKEESGNATFVMEHQSSIQPLANLSTESTQFEQAANETVTLVSSEKSRHTLAESSSVATGDDHGLTFTQAAGDYEEAKGEQSVCMDASIVISRISDSSDVKGLTHNGTYNLCPTPEKSISLMRLEEVLSFNSYWCGCLRPGCASASFENA
ncbi:hypothetical protein ANCCAN_29103, partial [Ancylostoma caninum]